MEMPFSSRMGASGVLPFLRLASAVDFVPFDKSSLDESSFFEQFLGLDLADSGWVPSSALKIDGSPYLGKWEIQEAYKYGGFAGDRGLVMTTEANFFAISRKLPHQFTSDGQDLVLQFEVKFQEGITCGGGYLKLLSDLDPPAFSDHSRYEIMFGPDICGSQNRVHFLTKKDESDDSLESRLRTPPMARTDQLSNLYTLVVHADGDMEIRINGGVAKAGNLLNSANLMVPPLSEPELIPDPDAKKPDDWDDRPVISDPSVEKPADYDEVYNSIWIPDPNVPKPEGWNDDESEPFQIADPEASKPDEWDDEEDGEWRAPLIRNPKCLHGCGKWEPPMIANTKYKGKWSPPAIENPDYKGEWKPPLIANPEFSKAANIGLRPINGIGIDVWSMQSGVMFDNIYLGNSVAEAERIGNETFELKHDLEYAAYKIAKPRAKHEPKPPPKTFEDIMDEEPGFLAWIRSPFSAEIKEALVLWGAFQVDPVTTMLQHPIRFAVYCFVFVVAFTFTFGAVNVLVFLYLNSREDAKEHDKKRLAATKQEEEQSKDMVTDEEIIAQIRGKATGSKTARTTTRKVR
ncbi:Calreticulin-domain-containing protein [Metschnikowia bicuspidata var. bicuspidata NRRL YB-4993]|uniref:Calreticulin-domain-containing protein n=1 Tax=Metschnikowia bicuspidata var. bicuspidata NRRL YB-4993 TaxID=869754 RepID=A0A1A0HH05_9ASCO|nr:Calreticulin-domain-containing protein [Metschnikowia bicuspidata var. bicuspidata NRRL YB-4993]OBA23162.1 Calreticulin-domain-containing protein [Metschnikowia bicuspidata var. bicuspidata NRRL YB-4993]